MSEASVRIKAVACLWCGEAIAHGDILDAEGIEKVGDAMRAHDIVCPKSPVVAALATARATLARVEAERDEARDDYGRQIARTGVAQIEAMEAQAREAALRKVARWIIEDAQYKAPEQIEECWTERWLPKLQAALSAPSDEADLERIGLQIAGLVWALAAPDKELDATALRAAVESVLHPHQQESTDAEA